MSLSRYIDPWLDEYNYYSDFFGPDLFPRDISSIFRENYIRPWRSLASEQDIGSTVKFDKDKFEANLDVAQFNPEEIKVRVSDSDNTVTIEGEHQEKKDKHGYISRHFVRKYVLPKGCDLKNVESKLSSDGVLSITAPRVEAAALENQRNIPITQTGETVKNKSVEQKK